MRNKFSLVLLLCLINFSGCTQTGNRIKIISITSSENTGQDYSSWLTDDLNLLVPNNWSSANFKYIDITLKLESRSSITKVSLYDYEGIFTDNPASVYALNGTQKTLLGTFTGEQYKAFVNLVPAIPVTADALLIHKYCNNIPEKIQIYGLRDSGSSPVVPTNPLPRSIITFNMPLNKTAGDSPFNLIAASTNTEMPVLFKSSNPAVISLINKNNAWVATVVNPGSANITASQAGNSHFTAAADITKTITVLPAGAPAITNTKIPIDPERWFQLTNASNGLNGLFDGKTAVEVHTGWGKILENYDSYYPVINGEQIDIAGIRMYDGAGDNASQPFTLSIITNEGQRITVATFTGSQYNSWVGPEPNNPMRFTLQTTFKNIRYLVINSWNSFPTEIEFYGNYIPGKVINAAVKKSYPLKQLFGVNGFEWNFEDPKSPGQINSQLFKAAKAFSGFRHYMDWEKLELTKGSYSYNPTISGGWNYDVLYDSCKAAGIEVLACLKTLPPWMLDTYPAAQRDNENVPVKYGKDFSDPMSYIEQSKVAFQYAARYGSNKNVDRSLLTVNSTPRWSGDVANTIKVGLGTVRYIECDNERDKWWKGRKAYQTGYEYAANLSAFYDGNKNKMGPGAGIKNADPTMKVVMAGTALASTDYVKGMIDWCRQHRGYNADGSVDLCWDIINYHYYANDSWTSQNGNATRGAAPEISGAAQVAANFIQVSHLYANDMPVWVTESGYDVNQGSPFKAIPIGNKTAIQTEADWILRTSLLYARSGIERVFFYEMYDDNVNNGQQFSSSGLINADKTRKPAADYIYQANKLLGDYSYRETINGDPVVDRYELNGSQAYVVLVPDEKGRTAAYNLDLGTASLAKIYTPKAGSDTMDMKIVSLANGQLNITATETPVFIVPVGNGITNSYTNKPGTSNLTARASSQPGVNINLSGNEELETSVKLYPNPAADLINISIHSGMRDRIAISITEAASGNVFKRVQVNNPSGDLIKSINIGSLPVGYYLIEIKQGGKTSVRKILKTYAGNFLL